MEIKKVENEINKKIAKNYDKKAGKSIKRVHFSGVDSIVEDSNKKFSSSLGLYKNTL